MSQQIHIEFFGRGGKGELGVGQWGAEREEGMKGACLKGEAQECVLSQYTAL